MVQNRVGALLVGSDPFFGDRREPPERRRYPVKIAKPQRGIDLAQIFRHPDRKEARAIESKRHAIDFIKKACLGPFLVDRK